jgi:hypothetical protein
MKIIYSHIQEAQRITSARNMKKTPKLCPNIIMQLLTTSDKESISKAIMF